MPKDPLTRVKRLFFDIETSPNIGLFWSAGYKQNISYENIIKERAIICICYKWAGQKRVQSLTWDSAQDDKEMLIKFMEIANQADELVGHNGDKFDLAWIRTRCLFHQIPCFPSYVSVDTLKYARSKFRFNSNRLDYIGKYLGLGQKIHTKYDLWKDIVLHKKASALREMVKYCKGDIELLEKIHKRMINHLPAKTHAGAIAGHGKHSCPECGSYNLKQRLKRISAAGVTRIQKQCNDCGKYCTQPANI